MAITDRQNQLYTDLLFKKIAAGVSNSNPDTPYFEQPITGRSFVDLSQIWIDSNKIPTVAQEVPNVVKYLSVVQLTPINGFPLSYWFGVPKRIIPFNYGDGTSYSYVLQTGGGDPIFSGANEWYLDPDTGVLTFMDGNPPGVDPSNPPYISCYEYIGLTADDTGWGGGSGSNNGSIGEWQDSVLGYSNSLSNSTAGQTTIDIYKDTELTEYAATVTITNGTRFIHIGPDALNLPIYNPETDTTTNGSIVENQIATYWDAAANSTNNGGWILYTPTTGTFSSVDYNLHSIIRFDSSTWINQYFEKTIPNEIELIPEASAPEINDWQILTNTKLPLIPSVIDTELYINNIKTIEIEPRRAYAFGTVTTVDASGDITNGAPQSFEIVNAGTFYVGQILKITTPNYGYVNIISIDNNIAIVSSNVGSNITGISTLDTINIADNILDAVANANNNLDNVLMFWHSVNAGYHIENDDIIMFKFNVSET